MVWFKNQYGVSLQLSKYFQSIIGHPVGQKTKPIIGINIYDPSQFPWVTRWCNVLALLGNSQISDTFYSSLQLKDTGILSYTLTWQSSIPSSLAWNHFAKFRT